MVIVQSDVLLLLNWIINRQLRVHLALHNPCQGTEVGAHCREKTRYADFCSVRGTSGLLPPNESLYDLSTIDVACFVFKDARKGMAVLVWRPRAYQGYPETASEQTR